MTALFITLVQTIQMVIQLYVWIVIIAALMSFVQPNPHNPIVQFLHRVTEPLFSWVREKFPFVVISGIDLSPIVIIFGLNFISNLLSNLLLG
jgi:YggT family protein